MKKLLLFPMALLVATLANATVTAYAPPVGGMTITVPTGQTRAITFPLLPAVFGSGAVMGQITGVGANFVDVAGANWTPGAFSSTAIPYFLRIKSGVAAGRVIPVSASANTATRLNLTNDGFAIDQVVSPAAGDGYELVLADTLEGFFGAGVTLSLQGGITSTTADNVLIWGNTAWVTYYYNITRDRWERSTDTAGSATRNTQLLRQDRGIMIVRRAATDFKVYLTGRVPDLAPQHDLLRPGATFFSTSLPVSVSLGTLSLQTRSPGWRGVAGAATALTGADIVQIWGNTAWVNYYYDIGRGSWQRSTDNGGSSSRDTVIIPAGQAFMIRRLDSAAAPSDNFVQLPMPYTVSL